MTIAACRAGKHVSVQKPMALSLTEADGMIAAAKESGVMLRVFENFVFYPPFVKAKSLIDDGTIGEPQMIRLHFNSGTLDSSWKIPLKAWLWRFDQKKCGGGPLAFDHGFHLFSIAHFLMGPVERVCAWIDKTPVIITKSVDGPATIMLKFKDPRKYGVMDFSYTPQIRINSSYYADDNRVEIIGDKGIIFVNQCTAKTIELPAIMLYKDGKTTAIEIDRTDWKYSFIDCTQHFVDAIINGKSLLLDGPAARSILQTTLAAQYSSIERREFDVEEVAHYGLRIGIKE
jgi:predicted dehydrogenase